MTSQSSCEVSGVCVSPVLCLAAPQPAFVSVPGVPDVQFEGHAPEAVIVGSHCGGR